LDLRETRAGKSHDCDYIVIEKLSFQNCFRPHENEELTFSIFSSLKRVLGELRFPDGLVWSEGLNGVIKLRLHIIETTYGIGIFNETRVVRKRKQNAVHFSLRHVCLEVCPFFLQVFRGFLSSTRYN